MRPAIGLLLIVSATATLNPQGTKCGEKRCTTVEYCSHYDRHCKPCSSICDADGHNYQPDECFSDCQEYIHDKRYVRQKQYEDLRGEIGKLWILATISIAVAILSLLSTLCLLVGKLPRWENTRAALSFARGKSKRTRNGGSENGNSVNNNNHRKAQEDAELGTSKHNGLKLTMPTISASVAPSRHPENRSASGSGNGLGNATPNTTTTSLSRRHPSEDTTLDYAYDNPAMTPSPEAVQQRTKRESSF